MIYELINPHDPYTFEARDAQVAALLCLVIGGGSCGADPETEEEGDTWGASIDASSRKRKVDLAAALRSLMIASRAERAGIKAAMEACPTQEARDAFVKVYEDKKRSSLTELASRARDLAERVDGLSDEPVDEEDK